MIIFGYKQNPLAGVGIYSKCHSFQYLSQFCKRLCSKSGLYENQQVHIVTRLDKDTSGVMLFAKHGYAHARLDKQLQSKTIQKRYYALGQGIWEVWSCRRDYSSPIARDEDSIITER